MDAICIFIYSVKSIYERVVKMKKEPDKQEYQQIVKNLTPKHNSLLNCAKAFVVGGVFCVLGEMMKQTMITYFGLSK